MNVSRLVEFLQTILALEAKHNVQQTLQVLDAQIQQMVQSPQAPHLQTAVNDALVALRKSATSLSAEMTPAQWDFLGDLDAQPLFGGDLVQDIENKFATNGIMPAVVKAFVGDLLTKRQKILENYRNIWRCSALM